MSKQTFVLNEQQIKRLDELQVRYQLGKSDIVRRGIDLIYDYLAKDIPPASNPIITNPPPPAPEDPK